VKNEDLNVKLQGFYVNGQLMRNCPKCKSDKPMDDFGPRKMTGTDLIRNQSWCKDCR